MKNLKLKAAYAGLKARKPFGVEHFLLFLLLIGLELALLVNWNNVLAGKAFGVVLLLNMLFCISNMLLSYAIIWLCRFIWAMCQCFDWLEEYMINTIGNMHR